MVRTMDLDQFAFDEDYNRRAIVRHSRNSTNDVSIHKRKDVWRRVYETNYSGKPVCMMCLQSEVGLEANAFHLAHVVPRNCGGENVRLWNRVPTCGTCNMKCTRQKNLLDHVAQEFPSRIVPIVEFLFELYRDESPRRAKLYLPTSSRPCIDYLTFVRDVYGNLSPTAETRPDGVVNDDLVYDVLELHTNELEQIANIRTSVDDKQEEIRVLHRTLERLQSECKKGKIILTNLLSETARRSVRWPAHHTR